MKILFIVNPVAGKGKTSEIVPLIEDICHVNNVECIIKYTSRPKEGIDLARKGVEEGFKKIVSVGGDGTLNEVVNGIVGSDAALGVIPGGTGNDFIRTISKSTSIRKNIEDVINGEIRTIDVAKCNDMYFINIGSGGFDAQVVIESHRIKKVFPGSAAYLLALIKTIFTYKSKKMNVVIDGCEYEKDTLLVAVANGKYYGGGILPAPNADIADGIFDICFLEKMWRIKMLLLFPKYIKGKHAGISGVSFYKGKSIRLYSNESFGVNVDGEVFMEKDVEFNIIHNGINIIVPSTK